MESQIHVLHVDDDPTVTDLVGEFLEREHSGFAVHTASTVTTATDILADTHIDCIVSDYEMPEKDGLDFLRNIREDRPDLPFILYTGKGSEEVASEAISAGVTDYLQKESGGSQYTLLANRIKNAVEQHRAEQSVEATETKLRQLAEKTDDVLFMFDGEWEELLFINSAYEDIWGGSITELEGNPQAFLEFVHPDDRDRALESMERLSNGLPDVIEYRIVTADGDQRWVRGESKPIVDDDGSVDRIVGFVRDITEQKERQQELERVKRQYEAIFNDPNILVGVLDPEGRVRDVNETAMEYINSDLDAIRDTPFWETEWWGTENGIRSQVKDWVEQAARGEYVEFEADITTVDQERTISGVFRPVTTESGEVEAIVVSDRDITERKERERELRRLLDRVEFLLETTNSGIWEQDLESETYAQYGITRLFGLPEANSISVGAALPENPPSVGDIFEQIHPEDRERVQERIQELQEGKSSHRIEFRVQSQKQGVTDNSSIRWLEDRAHRRGYDDQPDEILGLTTDITARKQREQAIQELHSTADELWGVETPTDVAGIAVQAARDILDLDANAVHLYDDDSDTLQPVAQTERVTELVNGIPTFDRGEGLVWEVFESGEPQLHSDVSTATGRYNPDTPVRSELILPLGDHGVFLVGSAEPDQFDDTDVTLMQTLAAHVTSALDALERERRLRALQDRTQELMHTPTVEETAAVAVEAAHEILESPSCGVHLHSEHGDELEPIAYVDTIREDFDPPSYDGSSTDDPVSAVIWEAYNSGETVVLDDTREQTSLAAASPVRSAVIHPLGDDGVFVVTAPQPNAFDGPDKTFIDILATALSTALDRVEREQNLQARERELERQNDRLSEFASIVSHDLRNPLNVAQGRLELAQEEYQSEHLDAAARAIERSQVLIDDLLTLARQGETVGNVEPVDLSTLLDDCWRTVETEDASLTVETTKQLLADRSRLAQLLENLIRNAVDHGPSDVEITVGEIADGFYVADDGPGIPAEDRSTVFEAGYSTMQNGTGFGLNIVSEIAAAHDWSVEITESADGGARFEITGVDTP